VTNLKIIVIISDTLRWDFLGCYGNQWIHTPNLDKFAERSVIFDKAYAGSFPTIPHRVDLFTGHYCFHTRGWAPIPPEEETFPELLSKAGYYTAMITDTAHLLRGPYDILRNVNNMGFIKGFQYWEYTRKPLPKSQGDVKVPCSLDKFRFPKTAKMYPILAERSEDEYPCAETMRKAAEWLENNHDRDNFLLYVDTFDPHEPWVPPKKYVDLYDPGYEGEIVFAPRYDYSDYLTEAELKHMRALYAGMVTLVDKWVGFLLDEMEDLGLFGDAAIIFTSDHGFYHGEHGRVGKHTVLKPEDGWPLYEEVNHIPLIMNLPDMPKGKRCNALVQPVDLTATILNLAGVPIPKNLHGQSILPVLYEEKEQIREIAVSSGGPFFQYPQFKLPPHIKHQFVLSPDPKYVSYSTITDGEWTLIYATEGIPAELYHLPSDPRQENNIISENLEVAKNLHEKFYNCLKNIGTSEELLKLRRKL